MPGPAILVKLAASADGGLTAAARLGAAGPRATLRPLFSLGAAGPAAALAPAQPQTWFRAEPAEADALGPSPAAAWDAAHAALADLGVGTTLLAAEPDLRQGWVGGEPSLGPALAALGPDQPEPQKGDPFDLGNGFGWHLDDAHSGLRTARESVGADGSKIVVAHLDTGYDAAHLGLPANLDTARQRNFVDPDRPNDATDQTPTSGRLLNRGHGTGTLGILAGGSTAGLRSDPAIPADFGELGGTPHAQVVPVRVANSVVEFWTSTIAQGIDYARQIGVDVLSMSMGGLPASTWADAVNLAYEAGIVLVTAAGNSIGGLPTTLIVYPARFNRVIAACGVMARGNPYYGLAGRVMEGCAGPASKMSTAIAAYTPNIPWLRLGSPDIVNMSGAGTSAATPQVAAAAALWLAKNGDRYPRSWQRVEAVRAALFGTAAPPANQYFGRGLLRAAAALGTTPDRASLQQTPPDSGAFAFFHLITSLFGAAPPDPRQLAMFRLELTQLALTSPAAAAVVPDPGASDTVDESAQRRLLEAILDASSPSLALRAFLERLLARPSTVSVPAPPRPQPAAPPPPDRGQGIVRRKHAVPKPSKRRLRVFATDPGDSTRLGTSFINLATVEVPWESLEPGPVGEYLEVVDVDPASNAFYPPVDLEHRYLLGQDGIAPSEGNPQFHQQMAYAVASRTIRNFELALGRRALWAERMVQTQDGPESLYVRRLRIYPHAIREQNAYYSPDRKALLFGYYSDAGGPSHGRRTIFTCLSHDVVAHETTHALLDGLHRRFREPTNPDVLAFHEAFADIVAIFQHFTFPELLRYELRRLRGNLRQASILSDLARQFGQSLHNARALREAITPGDALDDDGETAPTRLRSYMDTEEPHERGAILVAAVFEAFTAIYSRRTEDLVRLATGGSGVLAAGAIPPDLVERLAQEAVDTAQRVLTAAIRALDYMPPVDPTFGDYLRAIVTADADLAPDRGMGYRVAFAEAFARRGIYPADIPNVSPDGLLWQAPEDGNKWRHLGPFLRELDLNAYNQFDRERAFESAKSNAKRLHGWLLEHLDTEMARTLGLDLGITKEGKPLFEVHSVRPALRTTADGEPRTDIVAVITQHRQVPIDKNGPADGPGFTFRGGCTLLLDRGFEADGCPIRYAVSRPVFSDSRADSIRRQVYGTGSGLAAMTYAHQEPGGEPFQALHAALPREGSQA